MPEKQIRDKIGDIRPHYIGGIVFLLKVQNKFFIKVSNILGLVRILLCGMKYYQSKRSLFLFVIIGQIEGINSTRERIKIIDI